MTRKLTAKQREKFDHVEKGSMGSLRGLALQKYDLNMLCWRMAFRHEDGCRCWACVYVERQRS